MYKGQVVESAETEKIMNNPKHPYTLKLFSSAPGKDKKELLLVNLTKVLDKIENNQYDFEAEDLELKNLLDSLNLD